MRLRLLLIALTLSPLPAAEDLDARLARFWQVQMPFQSERLSARERAKASQVLRVHLGSDAEAVVAALGKADVSLLSRPAPLAGEYALLCPRSRLMEAMTILRAHGDAAATVHNADYIFDDGDPLYTKLAAALATAETPARP